MKIAERIADKIVNSHHMTIEKRLCSRFRTPKSDCALCAGFCPVSAISISESGAKIEGGCTECGACISACPNGAFDIKGRDDRKISEEIGSRVKGQGVNTFTISCEHGDETADLIVPCLSRLTETLLLEPAKAGASTVKLLRPMCEKCSNKKAAPHLSRVVKQSRHIYEMLGIGAGSLLISAVEFRETKDSELRIQDSEANTISRREFFGSFRNKAIEVAAEAIPDIENKNNGDKELFNDLIHKKPESIKRTMLLEAIKAIEPRFKDSGIESGTAQGLNKTYAPELDCIVAELEVSPKCTACGVCAILCPTNAITQEWTDDGYSLSYKPALCTNCGVCVAACLPKAIGIKETASLNLLLNDKEVRLFDALKKKCSVCRTDFVAGDSDICPLCINIHNKQMAAVKNLFKKEV